ASAGAVVGYRTGSGAHTRGRRHRTRAEPSRVAAARRRYRCAHRGAAVRRGPGPPRGLADPARTAARRRRPHRPLPGLLRGIPGRGPGDLRPAGGGPLPVRHRRATATPDRVAGSGPAADAPPYRRGPGPGGAGRVIVPPAHPAGLPGPGRRGAAALARTGCFPARADRAVPDPRAGGGTPARRRRRWYGRVVPGAGRDDPQGGAMSVWGALIGQDQAVATLSASVADPAAMTHAWLITGPPGSGRSVAARAFAAALQDPQDTEAQEHQTRTVLAGTHADVSVFATEKMVISIEEARQMGSLSQRAPSQGRWRVIIVEDADRMTERTSNVLLKAIEEPPPRTVWILCAPSPLDVLITIRSRCRLVNLRVPPV